MLSWNYGDISSWKGDSTSRTLIISSHQAPASDVIGDIEIRVEDPDGENPQVKATGRVAYTSPLFHRGNDMMGFLYNNQIQLRNPIHLNQVLQYCLGRRQ